MKHRGLNLEHISKSMHIGVLFLLAWMVDNSNLLTFICIGL